MKPSPSPVVVWSLQPTKTHKQSPARSKIELFLTTLRDSLFFFFGLGGGEYPAGMALTKQSIMSGVSPVTRAPFITACC